MNLFARNKLVSISRWNKYHQKQTENFNDDKNLNYLKARILGYIAVDGNITAKNNHYDLRFYPDHNSLINPFVEAIQKIYGLTTITKRLKNHYKVRIYSKAVIQDILRLGVFGTYKWRLPNMITDLRSKKEWLRAYFDAEATVHKQ